MLTALGLWQQKEIRWTFLPQSLGVAYLTTIAANTVRIGAAIELAFILALERVCKRAATGLTLSSLDQHGRLLHFAG